MDRPRPRFAVPTQRGRRRADGIANGPAREPAVAGAVGATAAGGADGAAGAAGEGAEGREPAGEVQFRALFDRGAIGVALSGPAGRFARVTPAFRELLAGTTVDPDVDGPADLVRHLPDGGDAATTWRRGLAEVTAGHAPVARAELPLATTSGAPRWVRATAVLVALDGRPCLLTRLEEASGHRAGPG